MSHYSWVGSFVLSTLFAASGAAYAATIVIPASQDTYVRSGTASTNYNGKGMLSTRSGSASTSYRGILQFDLSGVADPIADAHLEFFQMTDAGNTASYSHNAWLLPDTSALPGIDETTFDYNAFNASSAYNSQLVDTPLGDLLLTDASGSAGDISYRVSPTTSDSGVLTILNNRRTNPNPGLRFAFVFTDPTTGTSRIFGDHEGKDQSGSVVLDPAKPILLVVTTVPEPAPWLSCTMGVLIFGAIRLSQWKPRRALLFTHRGLNFFVPHLY